MDPQPVHGRCLRRQRAEEGPELHEGQVVDRLGELRPERRRLLGHSNGIVEDDLGLVPGCGGRVDLSPGLVVHGQHVEADAGGEGRFSVRPPHGDKGVVKPPPAIGGVPAEQRADDELLPGEQLEGLTGAGTVREPEDAEEVDHPLRPLWPPRQATASALFQVAQVAIRGQPDEPPGDNAASDHVSRVGGHWAACGGRAVANSGGCSHVRPMNHPVRSGPVAAAPPPGCSA